MKTNSIAVCLALILFVFCCGNNTKGHPSTATLATACIENILAQDDSLGKVRNHACENIPLTATIDQYVAALEGLDYGDCPNSFTQAFGKHLDAWKAMALYTDPYGDMRGEMHDLFDSIQVVDEANFKPLLDNIWSTWGEVEASQSE